MGQQFFIAPNMHAFVPPKDARINTFSYLVEQGVLKNAADPAYEDVIHGLVVDGQLIAYVGSLFKVPTRSVALRDAFRQIVEKLCLDPRKNVRFGVVTDRTNRNPSIMNRRMEYISWPLW
jgi:hypothetical protein